MAIFVRTAECTPRERDLMQACTDNELALAMLGNVAVSAPGLQAVKRSVRKSRK
jgi:hypothetical protein